MTRRATLCCSYPKCGRTWLRFLLANYYNEINGYGLRIDFESMFRLFPNNDRDPHRGVRAFAHAADQRMPVLLFDHALASAIPLDSPVILIVREPLDALVSNYFQFRYRLLQYNGEIDAFVLEHRSGIHGLVAYLNSWAPRLTPGGSLSVSYEGMHADMTRVCMRVLDFLGSPVDQSCLSQAIANSRFSRMQGIERSSGFPVAGQMQAVTDEKGLRARVGKVGTFSAQLAPETVVRARLYCQRRLSAAAKLLLRRHQLGKELGLLD